MNKIIDKIMVLDIDIFGSWFYFHNFVIFFCHYFEIFFAQTDFKCKDGFAFDLDGQIKVDLFKPKLVGGRIMLKVL